MKILILSPTFPLPLNMGSKIRIFHIIRELSKKHEITLISLVHSKSEKKYINEIKPYCSEIYLIDGIKSRLMTVILSLFSSKPYRVIKFQNSQFKQKVNHLLKTKEFDIIWINFLNMTINLDFNLTGNSKIILDQHNADELMWECFIKEGSWTTRMFAKQNLIKLRYFQSKIFEYIDIIISVSKKEAKFMKTRVPKSCQIWVTPNGVDTEYFKPKTNLEVKEKNNIILFCGSMDVKMNIDAVLWFSRKIFPILKTEIPTAEFWVVGRKPDKIVRKLQSKNGIKITSTVPDVKPFYESAKAFVAPFRFGGGTKLKVLEAMAMKVPVVSTPIGCQGIKVKNGKHLFIENDNKNFTKKIIDILQNNNIQRSTINEARKLVESEYSWESIFNNTIKQIEKEI